MAKKKTAKANGAVRGRGKRKAKDRALPGMEDHAIAPLERIAQEYADIRDRRMELTQDEHALKGEALKLMKKYGKTIYKHAGVTITVIAGEEDIKVRVKKAGEDDEDEDTDAKQAGGQIAMGVVSGQQEDEAF